MNVRLLVPLLHPQFVHCFCSFPLSISEVYPSYLLQGKQHLMSALNTEEITEACAVTTFL